MGKEVLIGGMEFGSLKLTGAFRGSLGRFHLVRVRVPSRAAVGCVRS